MPQKQGGSTRHISGFLIISKSHHPNTSGGHVLCTTQAEHSSDRHSDARRTGQHHSHNHCHSQSQSHKSRSWHDPKQVKQRSPLRLTRWSPTVDSACAHPAPGAVAAAGEDASALVSDVPPPPIDKPQPVMLLPASHQAHQQPLPHEQLQPVSPPSDPPRPADPQQAVARGLVAGGAPNSGFSTIHEGMDDGAATSNSRSHGSQPAQHSVSLALDRQRTLLESVAHATNASNGASSSQALPRTVSPRSATEARSTPVPQPPSLAVRHGSCSKPGHCLRLGPNLEPLALGGVVPCPAAHQADLNARLNACRQRTPPLTLTRAAPCMLPVRRAGLPASSPAQRSCLGLQTRPLDSSRSTGLRQNSCATTRATTTTEACRTVAGVT